jgi:hypothetical protein
MLFLKIFPSGKRVCKGLQYGEGVCLSIKHPIFTTQVNNVQPLADRGRHFNWKDKSLSGWRLLEIPDDYLLFAHFAPCRPHVLGRDGAVPGDGDVAGALAVHHAYERALIAFGHDKNHGSALILIPGCCA